MTRVLVLGDVVDDVSVRALEPTTEASDTNAEIRMRPGGSAANVAAWLGSLGVPTTFVGRAGADGVRRHVDALAEHDVRAHVAADPDLPTATIVLQLDDAGERTMFVDRGANTRLRVEDVPEAAWEDVGWVHLTGYTYFDPATRPVATHVVERARASGAGVSVDPSTVSFLRACGGPTFIDWIDGADLVLPNLDEARVLAVPEGLRCASSRSGHLPLAGAVPPAQGPHIDLDGLVDRFGAVVVTLGPMGAVFAGSTADGVDVRERVAAPRVDVVDTTGAGDAFAAGFLAHWLRDRSAVPALESGRAAAERCIVHLGARPPHAL